MGLTIVTSGIGAYLSGDAYIKALIMGEPGAGKTRSASRSGRSRSSPTASASR